MEESDDSCQAGAPELPLPASSVNPGSFNKPSTSSSSSTKTSPAVFDAWLKLSRNHKPFVEETPSSDLLNPTWTKIDSLFVPPVIGSVPAVITPADTSSAELRDSSWSKIAVQRLRHSHMVQTDDQVKWQALRKLKNIILQDPSMSKLGRSLVTGVRLFTTEPEWEASFSDAFQGKSVATLAKRAGSLWKFSTWLASNRLPILLQCTESIVYRYVVYLKDNGAPTTASSFLQAQNFLEHSIGWIHRDELASSRVLGASRASLALKRPLQQAAPLTVKMIVALENTFHFAPYTHWRIIAGHLMMCFGSCSRFGDTMQLVSLKVTSHRDIQLLEGESKSFKTSMSEERRLKLLPVLSLGRFFQTLPAYSEMTHEWLSRRMTTGEAALYLKEFLASSGFGAADLQHVGCHSLKTTLLSWAAKGSYLGVPDRLLMGHHVSRENQSVVAYSRDELTRIMIVVHRMIREVKSQSFKPDASRAERISDALEDPALAAVDENSNSDSDASLEAVEPVRFPKHERPSWDELPLGLVNKLVVHSFSGVVHISSDTDPKMLCYGRLRSRNFTKISRDVNVYEMPLCMQCRPST